MNRFGTFISALPLTTLLACSVATEAPEGAGRSETPAAHAETTAAADANAMSTGDHQTILATLTVGPEHTLGFLELAPGATAVLEDAKEGTKSVLPENVSELPLAKVFRTFAPAGAEVPSSILEADDRHAEMVATSGKPLGPATFPAPIMTPDREPTGRMHPDTTADNNWFVQNFCNGAQWCGTGSSYLWAESNSNVTYGYIAAMNGSEATSSATMYFWNWGGCVCTDQILWYCGGYACKWVPTGGGQWVVLPAHWISVSYTFGSGTQFYWQLFGGSQQMGIATRWH